MRGKKPHKPWAPRVRETSSPKASTLLYLALMAILLLSWVLHSTGMKAIDTGGNWSMRVDNAPEGWYAPDTDEGAWTPVRLPSGGDANVTYVRGTIEVGDATRVVGRIVADDCVSEIYVNGRAFINKTCGPGLDMNGREFDFSKAAQPGKNLFAFKVNNYGGPSNLKIDWTVERRGIGIAAIFPVAFIVLAFLTGRSLMAKRPQKSMAALARRALTLKASALYMALMALLFLAWVGYSMNMKVVDTDSQWSMRTDNAPEDWYAPEADENGWTPVELPTRGEGNVTTTYVRGKVDVGDATRFMGRLTADDCVSEIYVNGRLFINKTCGGGFDMNSREFDFSKDIKSGTNLFAFKVNNYGGPTNFRIGWTARRQSTLVAFVFSAAFIVLLYLLFRAPLVRATVWEYRYLILLLLAAAYVMFSDIETISYTRTHLKVNDEAFTAFTKRFIQYGLLKTKFGLVNSVGDDGTFAYDIHHPVLLSIYILISFILMRPLGWSENAAATLVPTLFSLGSLVLLYLMAKRFWGHKAAAISTLVMAMTPMFRAYGQLVNHESPETFLIFSTLYLYILWCETRKEKYLGLTCGVIAVGCFTAWPTYYLVGLLCLHFLLFERSDRVKTVSLIGVTGILMFSLFVFHTYLLMGDKTIEEGIKVVRFRASYDNAAQEWRFDNIRIFLDSLNSVRRANTPYVFYASGLFLVHVLFNLFARRDVRKESYILILLLIAAIHNLLWPVGFLYHDYWSYYFTPAMALASVVGLKAVLESDAKERDFFVWAILLALLLAGYWDALPDPF